MNRIRVCSLRAALATVTAGLLGVALVPAVAHAAIGPASVTELHVVSQTSTTISLAWHNPDSAGFAGTVVRYSTGPAAPTSPADGRLAARLGPVRHAVTVRGLMPGTHYSFAVFAHYADGRFANRATLHAATGPGRVRAIGVFDHRSYVAVTWRNPTTASLQRIVVRYAVGHLPPTGPRQGHGVRLSSPTATRAQLPPLTSNTRYAVAIWALDAQGRRSTVATTTFVTRDRRAAHGTLAGTVTDRLGHPLAGVVVDAVDFDSTADATDTTASDGTYSLSLPPGHYLASFFGATASGGNSDATGYQSVFRQTALAAGQDHSGYDAALRRGAAVTGRVTDPAGHGLGGVQPYALPLHPFVNADASGLIALASFFAVSGEATTQPDGTFRVTGLPGGALQWCYDTSLNVITGGDDASYARRCTQRATLLNVGRTTPMADAVLHPTPAGTITGRLTDSAGAPLGNEVVSAITTRGPGLGFVVTAGDGTYRIANLPAGKYQVCGDPGGAALPSGVPGDVLTCRSDPVPVHSGQTTSGVDIRLRAGGGLAGQVRGPDGKPLPGVLVDVEGSRFGGSGYAVTDGRGHYEVPRLPAGSYSVCFDATQAKVSSVPSGAKSACFHHGAHVWVRTGVERLGVDVRLGAGGAVSGTIRTDTGLPVSGAEVFVIPASGSGSFYGGFDETNAAGYYKISGLAPGDYYVCYSALPTDGLGSVDDCYRAHDRDFPGTVITVRAGRTVRHLDVVLATGGSIRVTVHDTHGNPLVGVDAVAVGRCSRSAPCQVLPLFSRTRLVDAAASQLTGPDGTVVLSGLPAGDYAICLFGYAAAAPADDSPTGYTDTCNGTAFTVSVSNHRTTAVTRTMAQGGAVSGTITDAGGHPLAGVVVHVGHSGATDYSDDLSDFGGFVPDIDPVADAVTARDGTFTIHGVAPGSRTVCVDASSATGGTSTTGYLDQCLGADPGSTSGGSGVSVLAGQTTDGVTLGLSAAGAITGAVTDLHDQPLSRALVAVFTSDGSLVSVAVTRSTGRYRVGHLPIDSFVVCFNYKLHNKCYDNVAWNGNPAELPATATPVVTIAGTVVSGVDARLRRS
jgi:hypothetical protein